MSKFQKILWTSLVWLVSILSITTPASANVVLENNLTGSTLVATTDLANKGLEVVSTTFYSMLLFGLNFLISNIGIVIFFVVAWVLVYLKKRYSRGVV